MGSENYSYEWERDFMFLWGWEAGFERETVRDTRFQFLRDRISNESWQKQLQQQQSLFTLSRNKREVRQKGNYRKRNDRGYCRRASVASEQQHKQDLKRTRRRGYEFSNSSLFTRMDCN